MIRVLLVFLWLATAATAQQLGGQARALPEGSTITSEWFGGVEMTLALNQAVPFRVHLAEAPRRLVLDFAEVDFSGLNLDALQAGSDDLQQLREVPAPPGWSRLEAELAQPMLPQDVEMQVSSGTSSARLSLRLVPAEEQDFARAVAASPAPALRHDAEKINENKPFAVVLDPGHGGKDPGARVSGLIEKDIVLGFARDLRDRLRREGVQVALTRDADVFVPLQARLAKAHRMQADLFLSIHADTVRAGVAEGATVYTLSGQASDEVSARLAARQNRADLLVGVDLSGADDDVTGVLLDLARRETGPRSEAAAAAIIAQMRTAGGPVNTRPLRAGGFVVLGSADIPSVLIEIGFLSSEQDRRNLGDPVWRSVMAEAIAEAILSWRDADMAGRLLTRN